MEFSPGPGPHVYLVVSGWEVQGMNARAYPLWISAAVSLGLLLSACARPPAPSAIIVVATPTTVSRPPSRTTPPTPAVTPSAWPDPSLPCGELDPEGTFAFLDCADIRRIRQGLAADPRASFDFENLTRIVDDYRASLPTSYNPNASWYVLWWGSGNYMARDMALVYLITGDLGYA